MKICFHCRKKFFVRGHKVGDKLFCSSNCAASVKAQNGFCESCLDETVPESTGNLRMFNGIGTGLGFPGRKSECPTCSSTIKRKWFFFGVPIVPYEKYRVIPLTNKLQFGGQEATFLARKLKLQR